MALFFVPTLVASAFMPSPTPALMSPVARAAVPQMRLVENLKAGGITAVTGTIASAPIKATAIFASKVVTYQFAFSTASLAAQLALFGAVYRYAVRTDGDDTAKQGTVALFALFHAFDFLQITYTYDSATWLSLASYLGESALAFGVAAAALEYAWDKGWARRLMYIEYNPYTETSQEVLAEKPYGYPYQGRNTYERDVYGRVVPTSQTTAGVYERVAQRQRR